MNRSWRALAIVTVCLGSSISADAASPVRLAKADVSPRVLRVHRAVLQLLPLILKGGGRRDSSTTATNVNCPGGGTLSATVNATTASTSTSSGGSASYSVAFTDCKTTDDTLGGSATFTYTASATNGGSTNSIAVSYSKANVVLKSASTDPVVLSGITVSTVSTASSGGGTTTTNTASGTVTVGGTIYTYSGEPLDGGHKP